MEQRATQNKFELKIEAKLENLSAIADFTSNATRRLDVKTSILEIQMVVDEACTNIIKYGYPEGDGMINITLAKSANNLIITIKDKGKKFDPSSVPLPDLKADLDSRKIGGLGMFLMKKFMDDVSYSFDTKNGNTLVMRKRVT